MEIKYERNGRQIYLILEGEEEEKGYEREILKRSRPACLLTYQKMWVNDQLQIWYDISGRRSLRDYFAQKEKLDLDMVRQIVRLYLAAIEELERYLIGEDSLYVGADSCYLDLREGNKQIFLCYCPLHHEREASGLQGIFAHLLMVLDHRNELLRETCYRIYDKLTEASCSYQEILELFPQEQDPQSQGSQEQAPRVQGEESWEDPSEQVEIHKEIPERIYEPEEESSILQRRIKELKENLIALFARKKKRVKEDWSEQKRSLLHSVHPPVALHFDEDVYEDEETILLTKDKHPMQEARASPASVEGHFKYEGNGCLASFYLQGVICHIGSGADNQIILKGEGISRMHAVCYRKRDGVYLEDLSSLNGTHCCVRGEEVWLAPHQEHRLSVGEEVYFAEERFVFR